MTMLDFSPSRLASLFLRFCLDGCLLGAALSIGSPAMVFAAAPTSVNAYFEDARTYQLEGRTSEAIIQLKNALSLDNQHIPSLLLLGQLQLEAGSPSAAALAISEALLLGSDPALALPLLAESYLAQGKFSELTQDLSPTTLSGTPRGVLFAYRAMAYRQLGEIDSAVSALDEALRLAPESRATRIAVIERALHEQDLALATTLSEEFVNSYPDDAKIWLIRATVLLTLGDGSGAMDASSRVIELNPRLVTGRVLRASLALAQGDLEGARGDLEVALEGDAADPRAAYLMGRAFQGMGETEEADRYYQVAANILSTLDESVIMKSQSLVMLLVAANLQVGGSEVALRVLQGYQSRHPQDAATGRTLASLLIESGRGSAAIQVLKPLLFNDPDSVELKDLQARAFAAEGSFEQAATVWAGMRERLGDPADLRADIALARLLGGRVEAGIVLLEEVVSESPERETELYRLALAHLQAGDARRARAVARKMVELSPDNPRYWALLTRTELLQNDLGAASRAAEEALRLAPEGLLANLVYAQLQLATGQIESARERAVMLSSEYPDAGSVSLVLAEVELVDRDLKEARRWAERAVSQMPLSVSASRALTQVALVQGDSAAALDAAKRLASRLTDSVTAQFLLAETMVAAGERGEALNQYKLIPRLDNLQAIDLYRVGLAQRGLRAYDDASASFAKALQLEPDKLDFQAAEIDILLRRERFKQALEQSQALALRYPRQPDAWILTARALFGLRQFAKSAESFKRALMLDPDNTEVLIARYQALAAKGDMQAAEAALTSWLERRPADVAVATVLGGLQLGQGRFSEARDLLLPLAAEYPKNPLILNNLAYAQQQLGDEESESTARLAYELDPASSQINDTLGWILVQSGRADEGLRYLRQAIARRSDSPALHYHLAVALARLGRHAEAIAELERALEFSSFPERDEAARMLKGLSSGPVRS